MGILGTYLWVFTTSSEEGTRTAESPWFGCPPHNVQIWIPTYNILHLHIEIWTAAYTTAARKRHVAVNALTYTSISAQSTVHEARNISIKHNQYNQRRKAHTHQSACHRTPHIDDKQRIRARSAPVTIRKYIQRDTQSRANARCSIIM